jgi:hypothetical protein
VPPGFAEGFSGPDGDEKKAAMTVESAFQYDRRAYRHPCLGAVSPSMA